VTDLHTQLGEIADELVDGTGLRTQADGARARHPPRRTRLGVAGAALAVALVAVGVPAVVGTSSAPEQDEPAAPALPTEGPAGASERLGDLYVVNFVGEDYDGSVIGAGPETPCPETTPTMEFDVGIGWNGPLGDGVQLAQEGCRWSTSPDPTGPPVDRVDMTARFVPGLDAADLVARLDRDVAAGCEWVTVLEGGAFDALQSCPTADNPRWTVLLEARDGTGAWELTTVVGPAFSDQPDFGASVVGAVWSGISRWSLDQTRVPPPPDERLAQAVADIAGEFNRVGAGPVPDPAVDGACPSADDELAAGAWRIAPLDNNTRLSAPDGCGWSTDATGATPDAERYDARLTARPELTADEVTDLVETQGGDCPWARVLPREDFLAVFSLCPQGEQVSWHLVVADEDGTGAWDIVVAVGDRSPRTEFMGVNGIAVLWEVTRALPPGPGGQTGADVVADVLGQALPDALPPAPPTDDVCPATTPEIEGLGFDDGASGSLTEERGCVWTTGRGFYGYIRSVGGNYAGEPDEQATVDAWAFDHQVSGSGPTWSVTVPWADGSGYYAVLVEGPLGPTEGTADSVDLLVALARLVV
jgi:hypothetical protein